MRAAVCSGSVVIALVLLAAGGSARGSIATPEELSGRRVAVVSHVAVDLGAITRAEFRRALVQAAVREDLDQAPKPGSRGYEALKDVAVGELLEAVWIRGQAAAMGIVATPRQVSRELARVRKQSFKSRADYFRYLKESHFTQRDVRERIRLQLLTTRMEERVLRGAGAGADAVEAFEAFEKFVNAYTKRWRARTVCAPEFLVDRCSNGPLPSENDGPRRILLGHGRINAEAKHQACLTGVHGVESLIKPKNSGYGCSEIQAVLSVLPGSVGLWPLEGSSSAQDLTCRVFPRKYLPLEIRCRHGAEQFEVVAIQ